MSAVTILLDSIDRGDPKAAEELLPLVYEELRKLAASKMANEAPGQTLQPTALVHEAWLRINGEANRKWDSRAHFFGAAAEAMRRILVENARRKKAQRHGSGQRPLDIDDVDVAGPGAEDQLIALNDALEKLAGRDRLKAELVKLRYFAGMTLEEAGGVLGISEPTAKRWWAYSKAWLFSEILAGQEDQRPSRD